MNKLSYHRSRYFVDIRTLAIVLLCLMAMVVPLSGCGSRAGTLSKTPFDATRATSLVSNYRNKNNISAISVAVVNREKLLWSKGFGTANKALGTVATDDTVYLIASVSKTVTATAVMQLVEAKKLDLDTDINRYLPFKITRPNHPTEIITLRQLLTHTSGIVDDYYYTVAEPSLYYTEGDPTLSLADFCRAFFVPGGKYYDASTFADAAPGTQFAYSNIGIALTGYIVESVTGTSFADYCKQHIFLPLGMNKTSWRVADFRTVEMAMPYDEDGSPIGNYTFADYPDGALRTTVKDLSRFLRAFILEGTLEGARILSPESVREMRRVQYPSVPGAEKQGLIWRTDPIGRLNLLGHTGAEKGTFTGMYYDPATGVGEIVFQNHLVTTEAEGKDLETLFAEIIKIAEGRG